MGREGGREGGRGGGAFRHGIRGHGRSSYPGSKNPRIREGRRPNKAYRESVLGVVAGGLPQTWRIPIWSDLDFFYLPARYRHSMPVVHNMIRYDPPPPRLRLHARNRAFSGGIRHNARVLRQSFRRPGDAGFFLVSGNPGWTTAPSRIRVLLDGPGGASLMPVNLTDHINKHAFHA